LPNKTCELMSDIATALTATSVPPSPLPSLKPGISAISESALMVALVNILNNLPEVFGLNLGASEAGASAVQVDVNVPEAVSVNESNLFIDLPGGMSLAVQLVLRDLVCKSKADCHISAYRGMQLANLRLNGAAELDRVVNNAVGPMLVSIVNALLAGNSSNANNIDGVDFGFPMKVQDTVPPMPLAIGIAALFSGLGVAVIAYSANRHTHRPVVYVDANPIPLCRIVAEDSLIVFTCFTAMYLFMWSNTTEAASVVAGGELYIYSFSLTNTVRDLWKAGLYPLSFFVCLFCGVYPYFKLLAIMIFSVVLQRPQSTMLRFIDALGKFSLLDTFVMMILVTGLEVKGIAEVRIRISFNLFLVATALSLFVGNYATHGWRRETNIEVAAQAALERKLLHVLPKLEEDEKKFSALETASDGKSLNNMDISALEEQRRRDREKWAWKFAIPAFSIVTAAGLVVLLCKSLRYNISGIAVIVTGSSKDFSLLELVKACPWTVISTATFTVVIGPSLYTLTFPRLRFLGAWCAADCFLLTCVASLVQLEQFIKFILGDAFLPVYQAHAQLQWPLLVLLGGMLVQWFLIGKELFGIRFCEIPGRRCSSERDIMDEHDQIKAREKEPLLQSSSSLAVAPQKRLVVAQPLLDESLLTAKHEQVNGDV